MIEDLAVEPNPNPSVPLAATVRFTISTPTRARVVATDADGSTATAPREQYRTSHDVALLGLGPGRTFRVHVEVVDAAGQEVTSRELEHATAPLPEGFPPIDVRISRPSRMEPGVTLVPLLRWTGSRTSSRPAAALAIERTRRCSRS